GPTTASAPTPEHEGRPAGRPFRLPGRLPHPDDDVLRPLALALPRHLTSLRGRTNGQIWGSERASTRPYVLPRRGGLRASGEPRRGLGAAGGLGRAFGRRAGDGSCQRSVPPVRRTLIWVMTRIRNVVGATSWHERRSRSRIRVSASVASW